MSKKLFRSLALIASLIVLALPTKALADGSAAGKGKKKEYKSPGAIRKILLSEPLHGVKGEKVTIVHITFPPGWVGGKHYHTGPVYVYVLKGTFVVREKGKEPQTLPAGTLYEEPIGKPDASTQPEYISGNRDSTAANRSRRRAANDQDRFLRRYSTREKFNRIGEIRRMGRVPPKRPSLENLVESEDLQFEILHPGGLEITRELATLCHVREAQKFSMSRQEPGKAPVICKKENFGSQVVGIDASDDMVERARRKERTDTYRYNSKRGTPTIFV